MISRKSTCSCFNHHRGTSFIYTEFTLFLFCLSSRLYTSCCLITILMLIGFYSGEIYLSGSTIINLELFCVYDFPREGCVSKNFTTMPTTRRSLIKRSSPEADNPREKKKAKVFYHFPSFNCICVDNLIEMWFLDRVHILMLSLPRFFYPIQVVMLEFGR